MEIQLQLRIAAVLFAIGFLLLFREIPQLNWRAIGSMVLLMIAWIVFCVAVHPALQP